MKRHGHLLHYDIVLWFRNEKELITTHKNIKLNKDKPKSDLSAPFKIMFSPAPLYRSSFNHADSRNAEWQTMCLKTAHMLDRIGYKTEFEGILEPPFLHIKTGCTLESSKYGNSAK